MSGLKYGDKRITPRDIMFTVPSMAIAVGILSLPSPLAQMTNYSDGWVSILLSGVIVIFLTWAIAKIASKFPHQSFLTYASTLISKPVAYLLTFAFVIYGTAITAYEVRMITDISSEYLFEQTPVEVIALTFFLIVIYAVSGSRTGIFRLNAMFLPIILFITGILILFAIRFMEVDNLLPVFTTDLNGYLQGARESGLAYTGFGILFLYISLVNEPEKAPIQAAFGMSLVVVLYMLLYLTSIAIFGQPTTEVLRFPVIELAKSIEIPGGFLDRMESIFFVIWMTAIFTTTMMAFDMAVFALNSILPKVNKLTIIFTLAPLIFFLCLLPDNYLEMIQIGNYLSSSSWILTVGLAFLLWVMYLIRGGKKREK